MKESTKEYLLAGATLAKCVVSEAVLPMISGGRIKPSAASRHYSAKKFQEHIERARRL